MLQEDAMDLRLSLNKESITELSMEEMNKVEGGTTPWCVATVIILITVISDPTPADSAPPQQ